MVLNIELEQESENRWIADIPVLPGVMVYGVSQEDAIKKVQTLALEIIADRIQHGEWSEQMPVISFRHLSYMDTSV